MMTRAESRHNVAEKKVLLRLKVAPEDPDALQSLRDLNPYWTEMQIFRCFSGRNREETLSILLRRIAHQAWLYDPETEDPRRWIARTAKRQVTRMDAILEREVVEDKKIDLLTGRIIARDYLYRLSASHPCASRTPASPSR